MTCSGPATKIEFEKNSRNEDNAKTLWEASEVAVGKFEI